MSTGGGVSMCSRSKRNAIANSAPNHLSPMGLGAPGRDHAHQHESGASVQSHMILPDGTSKDVCGGRGQAREREREERNGEENASRF